MKAGCATGPAVMMAALRGWARWGGNSHDRVRSSEEVIPFDGSTAERFHDPLAIALPEPAFPLQEPVANTVPHCHRPEVVGTRRGHDFFDCLCDGSVRPTRADLGCRLLHHHQSLGPMLKRPFDNRDDVFLSSPFSAKSRSKLGHRHVWAQSLHHEQVVSNRVQQSHNATARSAAYRHEPEPVVAALRVHPFRRLAP